MTELLGSTQTATYTTTPALFSADSSGTASAAAAVPNLFLPTITTMQDSYRERGAVLSAPNSLRQPWATLPWRPVTYYNSGRVNAGNWSSRSMPEPSFSEAFRDSTKAPQLFPLSGSLTCSYTRYTPNDWVATNQSNFMSSDRIRGTSERMRLDISRLCREADDKTRRTQEDVGRRLGDRIGDIEFWKSEVLNERDSMRTEIEALAMAKACLEKTLNETENPLYVAQECLFNREKRQGVDLVHDGVEIELAREVNNIKRCQEEMRGLIQSAANQQSLNRSAQHELEKDSCDKSMALSLDGSCYQLRNTSRGLHFSNGIEKVDHTNSVPQTWIKFTSDNITRSQNARGASREMRSSIEQMLARVSTAIMNQWNASNTAFTERTREYMDTKNKLHAHLAKVTQEIYDMEKSIELLKRCIMEKESPLQVAQTRLLTRVQRPNIECCRDPVQHRLVDEVHQINETVDGLKAKLRDSENTLQQLLRTKASLDQQLNIKSNSLLIDKDTCLGMRKGLPMLPRIAIY